jgi:hypothetical protein
MPQLTRAVHDGDQGPGQEALSPGDSRMNVDLARIQFAFTSIRAKQTTH